MNWMDGRMMDELSLLAKHSKFLISSGIWVNPLALAFPLQLSLANTRICALSSVLVMNVSWIAAQMSYQLATLARH